MSSLNYIKDVKIHWNSTDLSRPHSHFGWLWVSSHIIARKTVSIFHNKLLKLRQAITHPCPDPCSFFMFYPRPPGLTLPFPVPNFGVLRHSQEGSWKLGSRPPHGRTQVEDAPGATFPTQTRASNPEKPSKICTTHKITISKRRLEPGRNMTNLCSNFILKPLNGSEVLGLNTSFQDFGRISQIHGASPPRRGPRWRTRPSPALPVSGRPGSRRHRAAKMEHFVQTERSQSLGSTTIPKKKDRIIKCL